MKTRKEKELVVLKILADCFKYVLPITFLLKCQKLKDFQSGTSNNTLSVMIDAYHTYSLHNYLT